MKRIARLAVGIALAAAATSWAQDDRCKNHYILSEPCDAGRWTAIGPDGATVLSLAVDPADPSTVYAGTTSSGVLKSTDAGATWSVATREPAMGYVKALAVDPFTPSTVYAGTDAGVFRSADGGQSWAAAGSGLPVASIGVLKVDPFSPATAYAGIAGGGVFKTTDGAQSWTALAASVTANAHFIYFIELDPAAPGAIYIGTDAGAFRSVDSGITWESFFSCGDLVPDVPALAFDARRPSRIYVLCWEEGYYGWPAGLLVSSDKGATWNWRSTPALAAQTLAVDSSSAIYVGDFWGGEYRANDPGDGSTTFAWARMSFPSQRASVNVNAIASPAGTPKPIYAATDGGVFASTDDGVTWTRSNMGVRNLSIGQSALDPISPTTLYVIIGGGGVMKTTDGGTHWIESSVGPPGDGATSLVVDPSQPSRLYAVAGNALYTSADAGAHWSIGGLTISGWSPPYNWSPLIAVSPSQPSTVYLGAGSPGNVSKSTDAGITWQRANGGLPADLPSIRTLTVDPTSAETVFISTAWRRTIEYHVGGNVERNVDAKLFRSRDGGNHWSQVLVPFPPGLGSGVSSVAIDPSRPATMYVAAYGPDYQAVFKSLDGGETWLAPQYLPALPVVLAIHPRDPAQIYAGTMHGGVLRSTDGGASWAPFGTGFAPDVVSHLAFDGAGRVRASTSAGLFEIRPGE